MTDYGDHWWFYLEQKLGKCAIERVPMESVCILPKIEPGHLTI